MMKPQFAEPRWGRGGRMPSAVLAALVAPLLYAAALSTAPSTPPRKDRRNKYAQFSKAEQVRDTLRFSRLDEEVDALAQTAPAHVDMPPSRNRTRNEWTYPDASSIDQRDPTTFGFTEMCAPHPRCRPVRLSARAHPDAPPRRSGVVIGAHGTRGELRVRTDSDFGEERLCRRGVRWLRRPRRRAPREVRVLGGRRGPGAGVYLVRIADVRSREDALALRGSALFVRRELRPEALGDDELMLWQLEGMRVVASVPADVAADGAEDGAAEPATIGTVVGVVPREELSGDVSLGNDLLEVALHDEGDEIDGEIDRGEIDTVLVPYVDEVVAGVDADARIVAIVPPDGLLELVQPKRAQKVRIRALLPPRAASLQTDEA